MEQQQLKKNNNTNMVEGQKKILGLVHEDDDFFSHSSSSVSSSNSSSTSIGSDDSFEEVTSSPSSSSSSIDHQLAHDDPLSDMSSLFQQLPIKRGLSRFYEGKSQSFTSLANVRSLEDLAKAENPYNKRLKYSRSYGGALGAYERHNTNNNIKRGMHSNSRRSCSLLISARRGSANNLPPIPSPHHRSANTSTIPSQTVLFA
ncbi:hypothetical protein HN51_013470 [Arachis hypogaea]|uniref:Oxidative stress 3 n=2 Tax=Arachis TaxID=3817 RepID=A0A445DQ45_ARAHY|nr:protein OXIDATIVE STRESS 3 [Arachis duranensis]XP_025690409.1 uncharacterized protein LOC112791694 [Arachis hypogaea]QHO59196.1 uncharacterized protein DS421_3g97140 [Arachis hypogaea]RYR65297.1 hypothetical protein Ahy_A03g011236 [Arachis hypogaea]